jgi:hypothetical protein
MDELEHENIEFEDSDGHGPKRKTAHKKFQRSHRTEVDEANLEDDE